MHVSECYEDGVEVEEAVNSSSVCSQSQLEASYEEDDKVSD